MWPFRSKRSYPDTFVVDMHRAIVSTWNDESLLKLLEQDEDAAKRFLFSSFIQALIFYATSEFEAPTGKSSERSIHVVSALCCRFFGSDEEVLVGDYIRSIEECDLPEYLRFYLEIDSNPSNCLQLRMPLVHLMTAVFKMRLNKQLAEILANPVEYSGNLYDYDNPFNPRLVLAGVMLNSVVFDIDILDNAKTTVDQIRMRSAIFQSHSRDLLEAVVTTIEQYS